MRTPRFRIRTIVLAACAAISLGTGGAVAAAEDTQTTSAGAQQLQLGSTGPAVKAVQRKLRVSVTGYYGRLTQAAVRRFQRRRGLAADGVVGPATARALGVRLGRSSYASGGASAGSTSSGSQRRVRLPAVLRRIAQCESGGNIRAISRDGRYRGKFQFDMATWRSIGGRGDPAKASEATQDRLALKLYRARGTAPWANCA